ncbi:uncharacterized protein L969DRAFT_87716 [Mixia osmundae IAM 14324]|uniref:uncharacterized protein n=1 Tax=Mixia osmundae (strain CBS 9802 / IAM 14324 / JCM 22182 / KY 12970) TaxID=764103 RepID=UPI0004A55229|nr:uncharacterized protein L969DRAFT_87716 [Mixia osmundae IAM 14324]KEI39712.1 hypothetical protein L969DRAFT_87716 [Mixia osmundae IAM 14324]
MQRRYTQYGLNTRRSNGHASSKAGEPIHRPTDAVQASRYDFSTFASLATFATRSPIDASASIAECAIIHKTQNAFYLELSSAGFVGPRPLLCAPL